jgi:hypothetical protein
MKASTVGPCSASSLMACVIWIVNHFAMQELL